MFICVFKVCVGGEIIKPLISIIIPVFNGEKSLNRAVNSLIKQDIGFENLEILLIDDKSTDNSKNIIKDYAQKYDNIKGFYLPENFGNPAKPRNIGIKNAAADYVMLMDVDDYYVESACRKYYECIIENSADLVSSRYCINDESVVNRSFLDKYGENIIINSINDFPDIIYTAANTSIWNKIYRKEVLWKNDIHFKLMIPEDYIFAIEAYCNSEKIVMVNEPYYVYYAENEDSWSKKCFTIDYLNSFMEGYYYSKQYFMERSMYNKDILGELIVNEIRGYLMSGYDSSLEDELLNILKPLFKEYSFSTRLVNNVSLPLNIAINCFMKLASLNVKFVKLTKKILSLIK